MAYWSVHGPDKQRYYNHVCIFVGASPDKRAKLGKDLEFPIERLETCADEFNQAVESWNPVIDEIINKTGAGKSIAFLRPSSFVDSNQEFATSIIRQEVQALNQNFKLPKRLSIKMDACGEANAFYDPREISITICSEFVEHLIERANGE